MRLSSNEDFISTRIAWKRTGRGTWQQAVPSETPSQRCEQALELAKGMKRNKLPKDLNIDNQGLPHSKRGRTGPSDQKDCKRRLCGGTPTATQVYVFLPQTTHSSCTGWPRLDSPCSVHSRFMDERPLMAPGPVQGTALRPRECHWQSLQTGKLSTPEIGFSTPSVRHVGERFRFSKRLLTRRAVSTLPPPELF